MFLLCIKTAPVLFLLDLACEINRAIMRDWRAEAEFHQKRTAKEDAIKEHVARELRVPNWRTVMANNKYRADNLAAIANLIINKDKVFLLTTTTNSGQLRPT
jgi:hypothetical protein